MGSQAINFEFNELSLDRVTAAQVVDFWRRAAHCLAGTLEFEFEHGGDDNAASFDFEGWGRMKHYATYVANSDVQCMIFGECLSSDVDADSKIRAFLMVYHKSAARRGELTLVRGELQGSQEHPLEHITFQDMVSAYRDYSIAAQLTTP